MEYIKIIRRINAVECGLHRAYDYVSRHRDDITIDIDFKLEDKLEYLRGELRTWARDNAVPAKVRVNRRKQLRLACRLLGTSYEQVM